MGFFLLTPPEESRGLASPEQVSCGSDYSREKRKDSGGNGHTSLPEFDKANAVRILCEPEIHLTGELSWIIWGDILPRNPGRAIRGTDLRNMGFRGTRGVMVMIRCGQQSKMQLGNQPWGGR